VAVRRLRTLRAALGLLLLLALSAPSLARADTTFQLWSNFTVAWRVADHQLLVFDLEPKVLLVGEGHWGTLNYTQGYEYAVWRWIDLIGECLVGYTNDTVNDDVLEVTPRLGARFWLVRERLQLRDLMRVETRNRFYAKDEPETVFRWRNRLELLFPFNREHTSDTGAVIGQIDWEYFVPLGDGLSERYASRHRLRSGFGYRPVPGWRIELLYVWQLSRSQAGAEFTSRDHAIDLRVRWEI
jgi:Protein of unknown function (DUF2490)